MRVQDVLVRRVPRAVLDRLDEDAREQGLSRQELLLRTLIERSGAEVGRSLAGFGRMAELAGDLDDPDVMEGAW